MQQTNIEAKSLLKNWWLDSTFQDATMRLPADKVVTKQDAEGVMSAELRNNARLTAHPGGVAESITEAARLNENVTNAPTVILRVVSFCV